jgi:class 3 adenylate cyclase/tetratricopeptide (TPR) repeat protein
LTVRRIRTTIDCPMSDDRARGNSHQATLTILFEDLEGSTALAAAKGDRAWQAARRIHEELVREQVKEHDGREVNYLGDGFLVSFGSAREALACAVGIQRALDEHSERDPDHRLRARIGLNSGEVIEETDTVIGAAVNAAARVMARAQGGQILVSQVVKDLAGILPDVAFVDRGLFWLKGFPERWRLYEALWREKGVPEAFASEGRMPFVARDEDLSNLVRYMDRAESGRGGVVLIGGEAGVGKTRLSEELVAEAESRGVLAFLGRCYETEAPSYIPFVEILESVVRFLPPHTLRHALGDSAGEVARLLPELHRVFADVPTPMSMPPEQARRYLFNSVAELLERLSLSRPLLLVLDDLHWADESTLLLLEHLAQRLRDSPILMVGTYRDVQPDFVEILARTQEHLLRRHLAERLSLKRLPREGVRSMLRAAVGAEPPDSLVETIHGETDGNPFFVEEVYRHLEEEGRLVDERGRWRADLSISELEVPESLRMVLDLRLKRVSEPCRRILTLGSVVGRAVSLRLLRALGELEGEALFDALDEAERTHLIAYTDEPEQSFRFVHELLRQTLLVSLPTLGRHRAHTRVAEAMEQIYSGELEQHAAEIAYHLLQAGTVAEAQTLIGYLLMAGKRALAASAYEEALRHLATALTLHPSDERTRADLLFDLGLALRSLGRWDEGIARWREAIDAYQALGDLEMVGRCCWQAAYQLTWTARWFEAMELSARGLATLGDQVSADRGRLLAHTATMISAGGYPEAARPTVRETLALSEQLDDPVFHGIALSTDAIHRFFCMEDREGVRSGLEAIEVLRRAGELWDLANVMPFVQLSMAWMAEVGPADEIGKELVPLAKRLGHQGASFLTTVADFVPLALAGDLPQLARLADQALELCRSAGLPWLSAAHLYHAVGAFRSGRWDEAMDLCRQAVADEVAPSLAGNDWSFLFLFSAYAGRRDEALDILREQRTAIPKPGQIASIGSWTLMLVAVEGLAHLGATAEAAELYPLVLEAKLTGRVLRTHDARLLETVAGIAAAAGRKWSVAERHFDEALLVADALPHRLEQPEIRRFHARMLLDRDEPGDADRAQELLTEALEQYMRLGMPRHAQMARVTLGELGP